MKKLLAVLVVIALAIVTVQVADAAISATKHNLASSSTNSVKGNLNEICIYCHTPHGAMAPAAGRPLWNRSAGTTAGYSPYSSATLSTTPNAATNPASSVCFSCHDGVTSMNSLLNVNGLAYTGTTVTVRANFNIGGDGLTLTNDHPVGMTMAAAVGKPTGGYQNPVQLAPFLAGGAGGTVECSTCHAVHGTTGGFANLLRISNTLSALCLDCHIK